MNSAELSEAFARLETRLDTVVDSVAKIEKLLVGNGEPEKGIVVRLDRIANRCAACPIDSIAPHVASLLATKRRTSWFVRSAIAAMLLAAFGFVFSMIPLKTATSAPTSTNPSSSPTTPTASK